MPVQKAPEVGFGIVPTGRYMGDVSGSVPNGVGPVVPGDYFIDKSTTPTVWIVNVGAALSSNATIGQIVSASTTTVVPLSSLYTGQGVILAGTTTAGSPTAIPQGADGTAPIYRSTVANGVVAQAVILSSRYATQGLILAGTTTANAPTTVAQGTDGTVPTYRSTTATGLLAQAVVFSSQFTVQGQLISGTTTANSPAITPSPSAGNTLIFRTSVAGGWNPEAPSASALTTDSGNMASNTTLTAGSDITMVTTGTLAIGLWLVNARVSANGGVLGTDVECSLAVGTATATFTGGQSAAFTISVANEVCSAEITCLVNVTVAGTLIWIGRSNTNNCTAFAAGPTNGKPKMTGYTAVKVG